MTQYKAFSAPGKALLAGGYLVLDQAFDAYVVALSSRMHSIIRSASSSSGSKIIVKSPQFKEGEWEYHVEVTPTNEYKITEVQDRHNPFVSNTIETILHYINPGSTPFNLEIHIFSDAGYHSTSNTTTHTSAQRTFLYHTLPITKVPKTGLGSSAGLVTVLTTALLSHFLPDFNISDQTTLNKIHNLAQVAHCHAQGKVGSGFDVAAATFGSIVYRRFDPSLINDLPLMDDTNTNNQQYHTELKHLVDSVCWGIRNDKVALPPGIRLIMGDVKTGSNTPSLVSKVLKWRREDPESGQIYNDLNTANMELVKCLTQINELSQSQTEYNKVLKNLATQTITQVLSLESSSTINPFQGLINSVSTIRKNLKEITHRSGADIEPAQQTQLLNNCSKIPGVLAGVVPGAGGYDAISLLVVEHAVDGLKRKTLNNPDFNGVEWLELTEEANGIQLEPNENYLELL